MGMIFNLEAAQLGYEAIEIKCVHGCIATELGDFEMSYAKFASALECHKDTVKKDINILKTPG